jgi:hypothetical protein
MVAKLRKLLVSKEQPIQLENSSETLFLVVVLKEEEEKKKRASMKMI